ncbi:MAG TPA: hypothetical protein GX401_03475 [Clostridiales bacterium]|nr:hypothetical protein [Clostridiales bacterium]
MNILKPKIPDQLTAVDDLQSYSEDYRRDEAAVKSISVTNNCIQYGNMYKLDVRGAVFKNCVFIDCDFEKASFQDVIFHGCDFSNSNLRESYFNKCSFSSCKCLGTDFSEVILKQIEIQNSNYQY